MSKDLTKYVTTLEAAGLLGVIPTSVNHLLKNGKIKGQKKGHYWLVYVPSIEKYISTKSATGRPTSKLPQLKMEPNNGQE